MTKRVRGVLAVAACLVVGLACAPKGTPGERIVTPPPDPGAVVQAYQRAAAPGTEHQWLAKMAGAWEVEVKAFFDPTKPPEVSQGRAELRMVLGGRYLEQHFKSVFMDMPFEGHGVMGFDNGRGVFVGMWTDTMSTGFLLEEGQYDPVADTLETTSHMMDPLTKAPRTGRSVTRWKDPDHFTVEMFDVGPDGKEVKSMEMLYVRVAG